MRDLLGPGGRTARIVGRLVAFGSGAIAAIVVAAPVAAHGPVPAEPPSVGALVFGWSFEPAILLPLVLVAVGWIVAVRRVDAAHPSTPVPRRRTVAFLTGLAAIAVALQSGIERYDTSLFSVHMVQHLLLTLVAAPLIALGGPVTLALRVSSVRVRRRWILPVLHSRLLRILAFPVVAWVLFAGVMWATHFSPLFDLALENRWIHDLEHVLYLGSALLFWWPAVGVDPAPWRLPHPVRILYVLLQMPQNTFLAVVILNARAPLYPHYASLVRPWGPSPLADQQFAGGIMWLAGDVLFIAAVAAILAGWMRHEERDNARSERRADLERADIRAREARLAERLADEREGH
ncbi:MAG TPA: cytochrome c oxidase assembly protein [Candidatus Limnocylindrales bacterium]|jgi:putative copper resistance protein D|nr:cytochrome c oxidase assembly protein [Candidatus Limnocylindrales bacterium]